MSDSLRPYGLWAARLLCPWDSPGKNTGGGCHALLHNIHIRVHIYECIHSLRCPLLVMYILPIKKWSKMICLILKLRTVGEHEFYKWDGEEIVPEVEGKVARCS